MARDARWGLVASLLLASVLLGADPVPSQDEVAAGEFWSRLLKAPVKPAAWQADPKDMPAVAEAKQFLREGFGAVLQRSRWETGSKHLKVEQIDKRGKEPVAIGRYVDGQNQYIGVVSSAPPHRIRMTFPNGEYQYEPIGHRFAGKARGAGITLFPHRVHWLAVYPYKITGMSLQASPKQAEPGGLVTAVVRVAGDAAVGRHQFRVLVTGPDAKPLKGYPRIAMGPKGQATVKVKLPNDARPGTYGISARCVVTGAIAADTVSVATRKLTR